MLSRFADARVLAIDDTLSNLDLLEALLRRAGLQHIHTLADSRQAMELVDSVEPDLVLLDLHMPHLDGYAVLEQIVQRAAGSYLPVLVLTADSTPAATQRALMAGARDFVTKPFNTAEVMLRVGNLLETRALYQQLRRQHAALAGELGTLRRQETDQAATVAARVAAVQGVLSGGDLQMVFQPVVDLDSGAVWAYEALARFPAEPRRGPDLWFADAAEVGLGTPLEIAAISRALEALPLLPAGTFLAVNVSPPTLLRPELLDVVSAELAPRLMLELTEHVPVEDYAPVLRALEPLRAKGARLAVDDTGAGFASLRHILALAPDVLKLDISLVRGIDADPARRALAAALVSFGADTGAALIAEGIETPAELATLIRLGLRWGQGYHLGRPAPLPLPASGTEIA